MSLENVTTEDYDDAHYLSNQVEQAKRRAVLAASDAGVARDRAASAEQSANEAAKRAERANATSGADATEARQAASEAVSAKTSAKESATQAHESATIASGIAGIAGNLSDRLTGVESMAGIGPSTPVDGQTANLIEQPNTLTKAALAAAFVDRRGTRGITRTLYVRATGNDANNGKTTSTAFREIRAAVDALAADGPVIRGSVVIDVGPGTYKGGIRLPVTRGAAQDDFVKIMGPVVGGHPNIPTAVVSYSADTSATWGILAEDGAHLWLENLKFTGGFSTAVRIDRSSYLQWRNVHADGQGTGTIGLALTNQCRYFVTGGIIENFTNGIQETFQVSRSFGTVSSASQQMIIRNCGIGVKAKENCVGHFDYINLEDCGTGIEMQLYSGANMKGAVFKRNQIGIVLTNSEIHNETSIAWGTGADSNTRRILSVGNSSELTLLGWGETGGTAPTLRTGHRPLVTLAADYSDKMITGVTAETTVVSWPGVLRADWYAIQGKHARVVLWGSSGSAPLVSPFRILLRIGSTFAAEVVVPAGFGGAAHFRAEFDMVAAADGASQKILATISAGGSNNGVAIYSRSIDMTGADRDVRISAIPGNIADTITFKLAEMWG